MARKRAADGEAPASTSRRAKAAKVSSDGEHSSPGAKPASTTKTKPASTAKKPASAAASKKAAAAEDKTIVPTSAQFKDHALPLHVHVTHTPPTSEEPGSANDPTPNLSTDPGFVASLTLAPSVFSSGSFGWKGSRRVAVELQNADGKPEKVMVMMSFNATVVGSKPSASKTTTTAAAAKGKKPASKSRKKKEEEEEEEDDDDDDD